MRLGYPLPRIGGGGLIASLRLPSRSRRFHRHDAPRLDQLYHWVYDRNILADNNRCERELRPTVIARKVSFGSQSEEGAKTREILMSVFHTLNKRQPHPEERLKWVLDQLAVDIMQDPFPPAVSQRLQLNG